MKKIPIKTHPLQLRIEAFQKGSLFEIKNSMSTTTLKKVPLKKILNKDVSLPALKTNGKENQHDFSKPIQLVNPTPSHNKHLSFFKGRPPYMGCRVERMAYSQKLLHEKKESSEMKELTLKKRFLVRQKKMLPGRNCISAETNKEKREIVSQKIRELRKTMFMKKQREVPQVEEKQKLYEKAKKLAHECLKQLLNTKQTEAKISFEAFIEGFSNNLK